MSHCRDLFPLPGVRPYKPYKVTPDQMEACLWVLAKNGTSYTRAARELNAVYDWAAEVKISPQNLRQWAGGAFLARYDEIRTERSLELEERAAANAMDLVVLISEQEREAVRRTAAGLDLASGLEASLILRNLTQSKATQIERAGQIRERKGFVPERTDMGALVEALTSLGVGFEVVDGEASEVSPGVLVGGPDELDDG
jgi:hypothetical protein